MAQDTYTGGLTKQNISTHSLKRKEIQELQELQKPDPPASGL